MITQGRSVIDPSKSYACLFFFSPSPLLLAPRASRISTACSRLLVTPVRLSRLCLRVSWRADEMLGCTWADAPSGCASVQTMPNGRRVRRCSRTWRCQTRCVTTLFPAKLYVFAWMHWEQSELHGVRAALSVFPRLVLTRMLFCAWRRRLLLAPHTPRRCLPCRLLQPMYFVLLANELKDASKPPELRQLAGIMIKNGLTSTVRPHCESTNPSPATPFRAITVCGCCCRSRLLTAG